MVRRSMGCPNAIDLIDHRGDQEDEETAAQTVLVQASTVTNNPPHTRPYDRFDV